MLYIKLKNNDKIYAMDEYYKIENLIYKDKKFDEAIRTIELSKISEQKNYMLLKATAYTEKNELEQAAKIYEKLNDFYNLGYCYFLMNKIDLAIEFFKKAPPSPAQNWNLFFAEIFKGRVNITPTYLQIRAFLERDFDKFLKLNLSFYIQKIIDISEYLFEINPETNKFIARAFLNNDYPEYAKEYLDRAFDFTTKDAELYYLLAKYYCTQNQMEKVKENLKEALRLSDNYVPAKIMLEKIS